MIDRPAMSAAVRALGLAVVAVGVVGCAGGDLAYFEKRCAGKGLGRDTPEFQECVSETKQWIEETRAM